MNWSDKRSQASSYKGRRDAATKGERKTGKRAESQPNLGRSWSINELIFVAVWVVERFLAECHPTHDIFVIFLTENDPPHCSSGNAVSPHSFNDVWRRMNVPPMRLQVHEVAGNSHHRPSKALLRR